MDSLKKHLVYTARLTDSSRLITATSGNISARLNPDEFVISGSGKFLGRLTEDDLSGNEPVRSSKKEITELVKRYGE